MWIVDPWRFLAADLTAGTEITRTLGTAINDFTSNTTASMDGTTSQTAANSATKSSSTSCYSGRTGDVPRYISKAQIYGSNNAGYVAAADPAVTAYLFAKTGSAPANGLDGNIIGSISFTDGTDESSQRTITSTCLNQKFDHWWVYFETASAITWRIAEVRFYE